MSDWKRWTRESSFDQLPAEMKAEIQRHIEHYHLGDLMNGLLMCIQSDGEIKKEAGSGSVETSQTGVVLSSHWLVWAVSGTNNPAAVYSVRLQDVVIQDYADTPFARVVADSGIQIQGRFTSMAESAGAFIGLEENEVGKKFKERVIQAVQEARK